MGKKISQITNEETSALSDTDVFEGEEPGGTSFKVLFSVLKSTLKTYFDALATTLTNKTLTAPTIADFTNAAHDHGDADDGGSLVASIPLTTPTIADFTNATHNHGSVTQGGIVLPPGVGQMVNGRLLVTVSANDLVAALKGMDGNDPSATNPVYININGTVRTVTAATSFTLADGTNWFNAGSVELGTKEIDYFAYLVWDSNSSIVAISAARISHGTLVSDFSATTTNELHLANHANFTGTDDVVVIGRFAATLSLSGTAHLWTVPTFTNKNLIQRPIFKTRDLDWQPVYSASGSMTFTTVTTTIAKYSVNFDRVTAWARGDGTTGGTANTQLELTLPFESRHIGTGAEPGYGSTTDAAASAARVFIIAGTPDEIAVTKSDASNYALAAGRVFNAQITYTIG